MSFSEEEVERYARHLVLKEFGGQGQQALKKASVLIIGAGGLGAPVAMYLAAAGIGTIHIADDDEVSLSNLQRQIIHDSEQIGEAKTASAASALKRINPHVEVVEHFAKLTDENADELIGAVDLVLDGSDNFTTRYLVADRAEALKTTLVTGAVGRFDGSVTVLEPFKENKNGDRNPRYRDLFPQAPELDSLPTCAQVGVLGALTGVIGSMMALEAIKVLANMGEPLIGRLLLYDGLTSRTSVINYNRQ